MLAKNPLIKLVIIISITIPLFGISGCTDSKCKEARVQEQNIEQQINTLRNQKTELEKILYEEQDAICKETSDKINILDDTPSEALVKAICREWRSGKRDVSEISKYDSRAISINSQIDQAEMRWARTITAYKDCFSVDKVVDAAEILDKLDN